MRSPESRKAIHAHQARHLAPRQTITAPSAAAATVTYLIVDSEITFGPTGFPVPTIPSVSKAATPTPSSTPLLLSDSASATPTETIATPIVLDPAQRVYDGIANSALHALPPAVIGIASGGSALIVLLALYCYICRWYYRRLPRSTARWDVDDQAKKEVLYGEKPRYSPSDNEPPHAVENDHGRRSVPVGDSYFPEGETWTKFDNRTAHHPESFIYTGDGLPEGMGPDSPGSDGPTPRSGAPLPRPRPQFAVNPRRAQVESMFSNVSFPTTHRADSVRYSFSHEGYTHDGEVWSLASPGGNRASIFGEVAGARPSFDSTVNRGSVFGDLRTRGSVVIYEAQRPPTIADDPFAAPGDLTPPAQDRYSGKKSFDAPSKKSYDAGKKSLDAGRRSIESGKKSFEAYHMQTRNREARGAALDTLAEDTDESSAHGHGTISSARAK